jgi:hypothetical protein
VGPSNLSGLNPLNDLFRMVDENLNAHKDSSPLCLDYFRFNFVLWVLCT